MEEYGQKQYSLNEQCEKMGIDNCEWNAVCI